MMGQASYKGNWKIIYSEFNKSPTWSAYAVLNNPGMHSESRRKGGKEG